MSKHCLVRKARKLPVAGGWPVERCFFFFFFFFFFFGLFCFLFFFLFFFMLSLFSVLFRRNDFKKQICIMCQRFMIIFAVILWSLD